MAEEQPETDAARDAATTSRPTRPSRPRTKVAGIIVRALARAGRKKDARTDDGFRSRKETGLGPPGSRAIGARAEPSSPRERRGREHPRDVSRGRDRQSRRTGG